MKIFHFTHSGRLPTLADGDAAKPAQSQLHEYQALIVTKLQARARLHAVESRLVDETWRKVLVQAGKFPLPNQ